MEENIQKSKEQLEPLSKKTPLATYFVFGAVLLVVIAGGVYFMVKSGENKSTSEETSEAPVPRVAGAETGLKGQKFSGTNLANDAVLIAPGALSAEAQAVTSGWQVKSRSLSDGTGQVDLIPVGSEATEGDSAHTFNLKAGDKLYFVDLNPGDDSSAADNNKNDDVGILVDADGIIR